MTSVYRGKHVQHFKNWSMYARPTAQHIYGIAFNPKKSKILVFSKSKFDLNQMQPVLLNDKMIEYVTSIVYLGITIKSDNHFQVSSFNATALQKLCLDYCLCLCRQKLFCKRNPWLLWMTQFVKISCSIDGRVFAILEKVLDTNQYMNSLLKQKNHFPIPWKPITIVHYMIFIHTWLIRWTNFIVEVLVHSFLFIIVSYCIIFSQLSTITTTYHKICAPQRSK